MGRGGYSREIFSCAGILKILEATIVVIMIIVHR